MRRGFGQKPEWHGDKREEEKRILNRWECLAGCLLSQIINAGLYFAVDTLHSPNIMSTTDATTILSELNGLDLANPNSHRDAIIKAQSLINTLQDPGDKAMEALLSVSGPAVEK